MPRLDLASTLLLIACLVPVSATSSGLLVEPCNAWGDYGCLTFKNGDHLKCTEDKPGRMKWVTRPVKTDMYTLRADDDVYYPGSLVTLHLTVNQVGMKYNGLLLHAVTDSDPNINVGSFENLDPEYVWSPKTCPKAAMHSSAAVMPYSLTLFYRAPKEDVGKITFRCIIKRGPANEGDFFYPNADGPLTMAASTRKPGSIQVGKFGQSCDQVCTDAPCTDSDTLSSAASLKDAVKYVTGCPAPGVDSCSALGMGYTRSDASFCFYHDDECPTEFSCSASDPNVKRICPCGNPGLSSSTSLSPSRFAVLPLVLFAVSATNKPFSSLGFLALSLTAFTGVADAHNWLASASRAAPFGGTGRFFASDKLPCLKRRTSDTHAQVGKNQPFTTKWSANHNHDHYFVVVSGENEFELARPTLREDIREYLEDAEKKGKNMAFQEEHMRYRSHENEGSNKKIFNTKDMKKEIKDDNPLYMQHFWSPNKHSLWQYHDAYLAGDLRAKSLNPKFPWIEAAAIYPTIRPDWSDPEHLDVVTIEIEGRKGPGHYIAHWLWNGYGDCIDFDLIDKPVPDTQIYGTLPAIPTWRYTRVDHCEFVGYHQLMSTPVEVNEDFPVNHCFDEIEKITDKLFIYGVNVVPAVLPSAAQRLATAPSIDPIADGWELCSIEGYEDSRRFCNCDGQIRYGSIKADKWSDIIVDLRKRSAVKWNGFPGIPSARDQVGHMCDADLFGDPFTDLDADGSMNDMDDKACYCKPRTLTQEAKPNIPWSWVPVEPSDWMKVKGKISRSQQDAAYWDQWKSRTTVTTGKTCIEVADPPRSDNVQSTYVKDWVKERTLFDAVKGCDENPLCTSLSWYNPTTEAVTALYTGKHKFLACSGTATAGSVDDWTTLERAFTDPKPDPGDEIKINFQPADQTYLWGPDRAGPDKPQTLLKDVEGWYTDSGEEFGSRNGGETYGWRCNNNIKTGYHTKWIGARECFDQDDIKGGCNFVRPMIDTYTVDHKDGVGKSGAWGIDVQMCNGGKAQVWELEVENGVYDVTRGASHTGGQRGCTVENVRVEYGRGEGSAQFGDSYELKYRVSVEDGRLTLGAARYNVNYRPCKTLTYVTVKRVLKGPPAAWLPATKDPWMQMSVNDRTAVGIVKLRSSRFEELSSRWLFEGNSRLPYHRTCVKNDSTCKKGVFTFGTLGSWEDRSKTGAEVGLSDTPCTGDVCTPTSICGVIDEQNRYLAETHSYHMGEYFVDCKGATGKYIYVKLPGDKRILDINKMEVYRDQPVVNSKGGPLDEDTMVCYSVRSRKPTEVLPEYETTTDPEDSMFYSTCYIREPIVEWMVDTEVLTVPRWKYNNNCLECDDYQYNELNPIPEYTVPQWHMNDQCRDCDNLDL